MTLWSDDPALAEVWADPCDWLDRLRERTDAILAELHAANTRDEPARDLAAVNAAFSAAMRSLYFGPEVITAEEAAAADAWLESCRRDEARDYDPEVA